MTKILCDMCNSDISDLGERAKLYIYGNGVDTKVDCCIPCATRLSNKILSYVAEVNAKEGKHE